MWGFQHLLTKHPIDIHVISWEYGNRSDDIGNRRRIDLATKYRNFYAYQLDLHCLEGTPGVDTIKWNSTIVEELLNHINSMTKQQKTLRFHDSWLMYLEHFSIERNYFFGRFAYAEYGTTGELVHADDLTTRPNPKHLREGETIYVYFALRKSDGLFLLQSHIKINRPRVEEYIEQLGAITLRRYDLTYLQVCTLLDNSFFDNIDALNAVN